VDRNVRGTIKVDTQYRSTEPAFSPGDVTGGVELTPVALAEACHRAPQFRWAGQSVDYDFIPTAVFCQPDWHVGFTEASTRAFGHRQLKSSFRP
jgi:glutathione reductase (NADPH)